MIPASVSGVLLAAGPSRRFGRPKQLVRFDGETLVRRLARRALASRLRQVVVVAGCGGEAVGAALAGLAVEVVENPAWTEGQSGSVRMGLSRLALSAEAALFLPVDQPFLTIVVVDRLVAAFEATAAGIVVPTARGRRRSPVLFSRRLFPELALIVGDEGGRQLFDRFRDEILEVEIGDPLALEDFDTEAELAALERRR